ncbi:MAG TPA: hypothetical protein VG965_03415 [Patescibacteria group bacterium]|nr:hypothetical protein [Patescibacteria group bacterium]
MIESGFRIGYEDHKRADNRLSFFSGSLDQNYSNSAYDASIESEEEDDTPPLEFEMLIEHPVTDYSSVVFSEIKREHRFLYSNLKLFLQDFSLESRKLVKYGMAYGYDMVGDNRRRINLSRKSVNKGLDAISDAFEADPINLNSVFDSNKLEPFVEDSEGMFDTRIRRSFSDTNLDSHQMGLVKIGALAVIMPYRMQTIANAREHQSLSR